MKIFEAVQEHMVAHLLLLCKRELELDQMPEINFVDTPTIDSGTSFGEFTGNAIDIVTAGRHPMDVSRTLAHELVHWKQALMGKELDGSDGSDTENEANAIAGIILRKFGQMYPEYFLNTLP